MLPVYDFYVSWITVFRALIYGYTSDQINLKISQSAGDFQLAQVVRLMTFTGL